MSDTVEQAKAALAQVTQILDAEPISLRAAGAFESLRLHTFPALAAEVESLRATLTRVRAIHSSRPVSQLGTAWMAGAKTECSSCRCEWPCSTILALDTPTRQAAPNA